MTVKHNYRLKELIDAHLQCAETRQKQRSHSFLILQKPWYEKKNCKTASKQANLEF